MQEYYICIMNDSKIQKITGIVEKIIFNNKENGYHILNVELPNEKNGVIINAYHPIIYEGLSYEFEGEWSMHPKYGKQMKAKSVFEVPPNTKEGLKAYLSSSFFPGIGAAISKKIIQYFKDDVLRVFNEDIDKLLLVPGISPKKLEAIKESWQSNEEINEVMIFLQQFGISTAYAAKIHKHYGRGCVQKIKENPYTLARDIKGIGFKYADNIALEVGIKPDSEARIRACITHILESGSLDGHCYLIDEQITTKSIELLEVDINDRILDILSNMIKDREIVVLKVEGDENIRYYSKKIYYNEKYCANKIGELLLRNKNTTISNSLVNADSLSDEQRDAVIGVLSKGISILYGGPGCGKTFCTQNILKGAEKMNKKIAI